MVKQPKKKLCKGPIQLAVRKIQCDLHVSAYACYSFFEKKKKTLVALKSSLLLYFKTKLSRWRMN